MGEKDLKNPNFQKASQNSLIQSRPISSNNTSENIKVIEVLQKKQFIRKEFLVGEPVLDCTPQHRKRNLFQAITEFSSADLSISFKDLYDQKIMPSKFLATPIPVIRNLTQKVYEKSKPIPFPLNLSFIEKSKKRNEITEEKLRKLNSFNSKPKKLSKSSIDLFQKNSIKNPPLKVCENVTKICSNLLKQNKRCKSVVLKKTKQLYKGLIKCEEFAEKINKSNQRANFYFLHHKNIHDEITNSLLKIKLA
ncbi:unnamed protein product [Blepharisma stoltei]|uniref:Uncharacterized protein n=1 Tax=Blepharisma stoltei TaxID=1481888 RepID=A0AAU9IN46_9CILI|nr:unnamed protein product [Blepharisma stoltei]